MFSVFARLATQLSLSATMADLSALPFPASELAWGKLSDVMTHMDLDKKSACTVLQLVLGQPSVPRIES